ncbi:MAG TPA: DUF2089 domain-containing protein [Thermomicrobiales bacterium]
MMPDQKLYPLPTQCPVCSGELAITGVRCTNCATTMAGQFSQGRFANLNQPQWHFIETFIRCKGKIKDVEVALDISYPTVVARLNDVVRALGFESGDEASELRRIAASEERRRDILQRLERKEIGPKDALRLMESANASE